MNWRLVTALLAVLAQASQAQETKTRFFMSASALADVCRAAIRLEDKSRTVSDAGDSSQCVGYIQGTLDTFEAVRGWKWAPKAGSICMPQEAATDQAIRIFLKYMDDHPEELHFAATPELQSALRNAFPCT